MGLGAPTSLLNLVPSQHRYATAHWLQPCDRTVFKSFKGAYNDACQELVDNYGLVACRRNFCSLLTTAWKKAHTSDNITSGFRSCGIHPFNPNKVPGEAYLPSLLYTRSDESVTIMNTPSVPAAVSDQVVIPSTSQNGAADMVPNTTSVSTIVGPVQVITSGSSDMYQDGLVDTVVSMDITDIVEAVVANMHSPLTRAEDNKTTEDNANSMAGDVSLITDVDTDEVLQAAANTEYLAPENSLSSNMETEVGPPRELSFQRTMPTSVGTPCD